MPNGNLKENKRFNKITYQQDQRKELSLPSMLHGDQDSNDWDPEFLRLQLQGITIANHTSGRHESSQVMLTLELSQTAHIRKR